VNDNALDFNNNGDIASLKPIEFLKSLQRLTFYESTNIVDGDMAPLKKHKKLTTISFKNRRHYSQRREDFAADYGVAGCH
jgi:hypothetical protein